MPFEGSTAIVTGGASGLGLAITEALAARGTKVAMFDIQAEALDAEAARLRAAGDTVNGYVVDISDRVRVGAAVAQVRDELGPVLILVNSAGIEQFGKFADITDEFWDRVMAVNLRGPSSACRRCCPTCSPQRGVASSTFRRRVRRADSRIWRPTSAQRPD